MKGRSVLLLALSVLIEDPPGLLIDGSTTLSRHALYRYGRMQEVGLDK